MRRIFATVGIVFLLAACGKPQKPAELSADAKMSQLIVGSWALPGRGSTIEIDADGSWTSDFTNRREGRYLYQCDWKITNGWIVITVDNVVAKNTNAERAGSVDRVKIISLDATNMVWKEQVRVVSNNVEGKEEEDVSLHRIK